MTDTSGGLGSGTSTAQTGQAKANASRQRATGSC